MMSVLFNIADKITFGTEPPDYLTFRKRVLDDDGVILDDEQLREDMLFVFRNKPTWFGSAAVSKVGVLYGAPDLDGTVTRATVKTGVNKNGVLGTRVAGERPWSYKGGRIADLVEPSATNLLQRSEEFDNAYWGKAGTTTPTVTANAITAPDGTTTADLLTGTGGASMRLQRSLTVTTGAHTFSFFVKNNTETVARFNTFDGSTDRGATFTFASESFTAVSANLTVGFEKLTNGWYRIFGNYPSFGSTTANVQLFVSGTLSLYYWGAQLETGSVATSYIKTVASTATRNADVLTVTGASGVIGQTSGAIYAKVDWRDMVEPNARQILTISKNNLSSERISIATGGTQQRQLTGLHLNSTVDGVSQASVGQFPSGVAKLVCVYTTSSIKLFVNGVSITQSNITNLITDINTITIGHRANAQQFNDHIFRTAIFDRVLTDQEAIDLTTP